MKTLKDVKVGETATVARLHDVAHDADGDDQEKHAGRGGRITAGRRLCVVACLEQDDEGL